jgi:hypothetical protein
MVAYVTPVEEKETYTLTGTGSHTLTEAQRSARSLTVLAEKVLLSPPPQYFNFIYPEPQSFWGYVQWVYRDYVNETRQLEYRRQVLLASDWVEGERNRQLLCLIGISQELAYLRLLDLMGIGGVPQEDRAVSYENWKTETDVQFLNQVRPETALWYEVTPGYGLQITIIWRPHWEACKPMEPPVFLPPPRGTTKDEQRPNNGGGGQQPIEPPPPGRRDDPLSDSPAPPPDTTGGPPSPVPGLPPFTGTVRVVWGGGAYLLDNCTEEPFPLITIDVALSSPNDVVSVRPPVPGQQYLSCNRETNDYIFYLQVNGQSVGQSYGPAKFVRFPELISVTPI